MKCYKCNKNKQITYGIYMNGAAYEVCAECITDATEWGIDKPRSEAWDQEPDYNIVEELDVRISSAERQLEWLRKKREEFIKGG